MTASSPSDGNPTPPAQGAEPGTDQSGGTPAQIGPGGVGSDPNVASQPNVVAPGVVPTPTPAPQPGVVGGPAQSSNGVVLQQNLTYDTRFPYALVGRFETANPNQIRFNFPGSKIGVAFTGTSLAVRLTDDAADSFDVVIDGVEYASPTPTPWVVDAKAPLVACVPVAQVPTWDGNSYPGCVLATPSINVNAPTTYPIATGLADGNHVAWLTKRTEFAKNGMGTMTLWGFELAPGAQLLPPPPYLTRRLEFLGDSSFSGYGSAQRSPCTEGARNHDAGRDLPTFVANYLHAERVNLSISGEGVYFSYWTRNPARNLPRVYRQTVGFEATPSYDFTRDHVDAVLLSAGGGDLWGSSGKGAFTNPDGSTVGAREGFVAAYVDMLSYVRSVRPDATIFATLVAAAAGNDIITLGGALQDAVAARQAAGDANVVYYTHFPAGDAVRNPRKYVSIFDAVGPEKLWFGCNSHPSPVMARYLTSLLGPFVAARMGWTDVGP